MNKQAENHPEKETLVAFGMGKLDPTEAKAVEEHLELCSECCDTIVDLDPKDDTFVSLVRKAPAPDEAQHGQTGATSDVVVSPSLDAATDQPIQATVDVQSGATGVVTKFADLPRELREHPRYEILELIGHGGMGDVYKAQHKVMNRLVALKVIKPELVRNEAAVSRFRREVQAAAQLHHNNIVTAHDAEQAGNLHFLVMEYVDGVDLDAVIREQDSMPVEKACNYIRQTAEGLQHAHDLGMVHRDIKPHNLMVESRGLRVEGKTVHGKSDSSLSTLNPQLSTVKILDFGLANFASEVAEDELKHPEAGDETGAQSVESTVPGASILHQLTQMGTMMGTPDYIAPEQAQDAHTADIRADIYSLGCTFYTLLAGRTPFGEGSVLDKVTAHTEQDAPPLSDFRDDVPEEVEAVLRKMMAKDPAERYQTPAEVAEALASVAASFQLAKVEEKDRQAGSSSPRKRRPLVLTAIATLFLTLLAAAVTIFYIQTNNGVVRVEVTDPSLKVSIAGQTITTDDNAKPLTIRAGAQKLIVRQKDSDFELVTDSFQLRRGDRVVLKVELLPGEVVVSKDGAKLDSAKIEFGGPITPVREVVVRYTTSKKGSEIRLHGEVLEGPEMLFNRLRSLVQQDPNLVVHIEGNNLNPLARDFEQLNTLIASAGVVHVKLPDGLREERTKAMERSLKARDRYPREAALRNIGIALKRHYDEHGAYPPLGVAGNFDSNGRPYLSWRVHLLPDLGEEKLYRKFRLDQSWDSPHNRQLLQEMPDVFKTTEDPTRTTLLAVIGDGTAYEGRHGLSPDSFHDGLSNIGVLVDVGDEKAVPWTKPEDIPFEPTDPIRPFGSPPYLDEFLVLLADGSVQAVSKSTATESLRALFTRAAGDTFDETAKRTTPLPSAESPVNELTPIGQLEGHRSWISDLVWHPDGVRAVSINSEGVGALDPCVRMWNVAERKLVWEFKRGDYLVGSAVAISPDGGLVAVSPWGVKEHVLLLDADTGEEVRKLKMDFEGVITALDFSPKHDWLAAAARPDEGGMQVWNWKTGETVTLREGGASYDVRFTPDGGRLLTGGDSLVWRPTEGLPDHEKRADGQGSRSKGKTIRQIAVSPDGRLWATADSEGVVELLPCWNPAAAKFGRIRSYPPETYFAGVTLTFTPDSRHLISAGISGERADVKSAIGKLIIWDVETMKPVIETHRQNPYRTSLALSPDGRTLLTTGQPESNKINIWQLPESVWPKSADALSLEQTEAIARAVEQLLDDLQAPDWQARIRDPRPEEGVTDALLDASKAMRTGDLRAQMQVALRGGQKLRGAPQAAERLRSVLEEFGVAPPSDAPPEALIGALIVLPMKPPTQPQNADEQPTLSPDELFQQRLAQGRQAFMNLRCLTCHGDSARAPSLAGIYGSENALESGKSVTVDDSYLRESILDPKAKIRRGWRPIMPSYKDQIQEEDVLSLIAFIKSLNAAPQKPLPESASPDD